MIYYNYIIYLSVLREQSACRYCISRNDFRALNENQRFENAALLSETNTELCWHSNQFVSLGENKDFCLNIDWFIYLDVFTVFETFL